jgi:hypothetical protein
VLYFGLHPIHHKPEIQKEVFPVQGVPEELSFKPAECCINLGKFKNAEFLELLIGGIAINEI